MKKNSKRLRTLTALAIILVVTVGFVTNIGIGTISAPGIWDISVLCPLGALGTMLATKTALPRALISLAIMCILIVIFARAFCGWICPVPLLGRLRDALSRKPTENKQGNKSSACKSCAETCAAKRGASADARHFVLGGALLSTFIFGFPVFCLVCPIGLTFAVILLVINLFAHGDVTWSIIVVPLILTIEVVFFKEWCHKLCPLSAFMSLIGKLNKTFVVHIDDDTCLETGKGHACGACFAACPEGIDPRHPKLSKATMSECTKCRACIDACPSHAIDMPLLPQKNQATSLQEATSLQQKKQEHESQKMPRL